MIVIVVSLDYNYTNIIVGWRINNKNYSNATRPEVRAPEVCFW